jgi:transposase
MNSEQLFKTALGIENPWFVDRIHFQDKQSVKELHIDIDFKRGSKFPDECGILCDVHDTTNKTWRHLNFFQHPCYLHCRVPRITTSTGQVKLVETSWSRPGSGFTLLFEAYVMALIESEMPINKIGQLVGENPHRMWTIFNHWVEKAYSSDQPKAMEKLGLDETSRRKGHDYITIAVDLDERRVVHATPGKDIAAVKAIKEYLVSKSVAVDEIKDASIDMSPSFISGITKHFPEAEIHFDRFHVVKLLNEAMDEVRKVERKEHEELKGQKYTFLKNQENLSTKRREELSRLIKLFPTLGEAYRLKELFNDLWDMDSQEEATQFLVEWCREVESSKIEPFKQFAKSIKAHWTGIVNFCETRINNGILEGINNKIQLAKKRARGYRCVKNFINMIYFLCGKLEFDYPLYSS